MFDISGKTFPLNSTSKSAKGYKLFDFQSFIFEGKVTNTLSSAILKRCARPNLLSRTIPTKALMNNVFNANLARISNLGELTNAAGDVTINLTETLIHFTNSAMHFLHNNFNSTLDSRTAIMAQMISLASPARMLFGWLKQQYQLASFKITDSALKELLQNLSYRNDTIIKATSKSSFENVDGMDDNGMRREEHAPQLTTSAMIKVYVLSFMALFSLVGNILTMWNIFKTRISRRTSRQNWSAIYFLIFHLSIADLLVTGFCIIGEAAWCYTVAWAADSEKIFQNSTQDACTTQPLRQSNRQRLIHKAKMKSLRISVVIIIAFLVCWTPYYVMMVIFMFWNPDIRLGEDLQSAIFFFGMSNSLINPLIYDSESILSLNLSSHLPDLNKNDMM
ncbi:hypothetical protein GQX74_014814 [Glossina fuscipes]|nr:hypothetical protein GQX74_014814 [Glossina fuscipes]